MKWPFKRRQPLDDESTREVNSPGRQGFGRGYDIHYTRHAQPDPGIAAFSYDTLLLPLYTPIGAGVQNRRQMMNNPVVWQNQAIGITTIGNPGNLAGQFVSTPLVDPQSGPGGMKVAALPAPGSFLIPQGWGDR